MSAFYSYNEWRKAAIELQKTFGTNIPLEWLFARFDTEDNHLIFDYWRFVEWLDVPKSQSVQDYIINHYGERAMKVFKKACCL